MPLQNFHFLSFHRGTRNKLCNYVFPLDWCFDRYIAYSSSSADLCHLCARNCVRENMDFFCETKLKFETFRSIACGLIHFKDFTNLRVLNSKRYLPNTFLFPSKFHKRSDIETPTRTHVKSPLFVQYACVSWTRKWWCWSSLCGSNRLSANVFFCKAFVANPAWPEVQLRIGTEGGLSFCQSYLSCGQRVSTHPCSQKCWLPKLWTQKCWP